MQVKNVTKNTILAKNALVAKKWQDKIVGLISHKNPVALLLKTHYGIHTFGMKYAIDVVILDEKHKIVATKHSLQPNRIFVWNPKYNTVLELPEGTIRQTKTTLKDTLDLKM